MFRFRYTCGCLPLFVLLICCAAGNAQDSNAGIFAKERLVAWCIVPFDAKQRGPAERAEMLARLGMTRVAYDWRAKHVPSFEEEILQYKKHGLEYFAFWSWHDSMEPLIKKHGIHPQIWMMVPQAKAKSQIDKVREAAMAIFPMVKKTKSLGCKLGIYNHGGWGGEPENMVAVCEYLIQHHAADNVGIVYNFHHGHEHMVGFDRELNVMKPHLLCLNINGMDDADVVAAGRNKILPVGSGKHERLMLQAVQQSGYDGAIGILDHRNDMDSEESLHLNLTGLAKLVAEGL